MVDPPEPLDGLARSPGDGKRVKNCELRGLVMAFNLKAELIDPKIHTFWLILLLFVFFCCYCENTVSEIVRNL